VSRRYIADLVAKRNRTAASAAFVGSSAVGMAAGAVLRVQGVGSHDRSTMWP
jgi:hypothetical protein